MKSPASAASAVDYCIALSVFEVLEVSSVGRQQRPDNGPSPLGVRRRERRHRARSLLSVLLLLSLGLQLRRFVHVGDHDGHVNGVGQARRVLCRHSHHVAGRLFVVQLGLGPNLTSLLGVPIGAGVVPVQDVKGSLIATRSGCRSTCHPSPRSCPWPRPQRRCSCPWPCSHPPSWWRCPRRTPGPCCPRPSPPGWLMSP